MVKDNIALQYVPVSTSEQERVKGEVTHAVTEGKDGSYAPAYKFRRFPLRALVLIVIPPIILAYFVVLKTSLLSEDPEIVPYGHRNAKWVYYSWFFIGVFGLSASAYGLEGAEAAMLQDPFWAPKNGLVLFGHAEKTWGGLGGWWELIKGTARSRGKKRLVGRLWTLLAVLSLAVYIALPLSGLAMELSDGYVKSTGHPKVLGRTWHNFNDRIIGDAALRANTSWHGGAPMTLPALGIIYTSPDTNRADFEGLRSFPNTMPQTDGLMDMFLAPQAENLVEGRVWGIRLGYKCDIVTSVSNFTLLNQRRSIEPSDSIGNPFYAQLNQTRITFWNSGVKRAPPNTWAYGEMAETLNSGDLSPGNASAFDEGGLEAANNVLEIALWQLRREIFYLSDVGEYDFDETIQPSISDFGSPFFYDSGAPSNLSMNSSFFPENAMKGGFNLSLIADPTYKNWTLGISEAEYPLLAIAQPVGVRCLHNYDRGYADIHPESATFTSFESTGDTMGQNGMTAEAGFGAIALKIMERNYYGLYPITSKDVQFSGYFYNKFIDAQSLAQTVMRAYAMDALQLMYDGETDFTNAYEHENLTATKQGKILGPGDIPLEVPLVFFAIWAFGCMAIGVIYGFKPRWAETLNGFSMFVLGGDFANEVRNSDVVIYKDYAYSEGLGQIPGMVGDGSGSGASGVGRLTLVDRKSGNVANTSKLYR